MIRHPEPFVLLAALSLLPGFTVAQADLLPGQGEQAAPSTAPPSEGPPPAPSAVPAPPAGSAQPQGVPSGQWVHTAQYGWIWMPYSDAYTFVPASGYGDPYVYAYYPIYGWAWIVAPWIWGWGPWPDFGFYGPSRYAWYGHGWWRTPGRWGPRHVGGGFVARSGVVTAPYYRGGGSHYRSGGDPYRGGGTYGRREGVRPGPGAAGGGGRGHGGGARRGEGRR